MARKTGPQFTSGATGKLPPPRLKKIYRDTIIPKMTEQFGYESMMQAPRLVKIVVNMGTGIDEKELDNSIRDMAVITGQRPVSTVSRKSIAQFKLREGMKVGCMTTLRGDRMWHFLDKVATVALPRIRDFQGLNPRSFDGRGNFSFGLKEQLVFPEIDYDTFDKIRGMDITVCTTAKNDAEAHVFLKLLGMPIRER